MEHEKCATCKPLTNGDKIRAMTDEELATLISGGDHICDRIPEWVCKGAKCFDCCLAWLRSPVAGMETINGITKNELQHALKWLYDHFELHYWE